MPALLRHRKRDMLPIGVVLFLIPYSILGVWLAWPYAVNSFNQGEISKSQIGLSNIWLLKGGLIVLFVLLFLAALSQLIKAVSGIFGNPVADFAGAAGGEDS